MCACACHFVYREDFITWKNFTSFLFLPVGVEIWHLELITGLVMLISSCRYFLLRTWPDFAESTEAANRQVDLFSFLRQSPPLLL